MNVYDCAHELARALKKSEEYQTLLEAKTRVEADPKNKEMLLTFRRSQWKAQKARAVGKEIDEAQLQKLQHLTELVNLNPTIRDLITAEFRFARLMADIQKILTDALTEWSQMAEEMFGSEDM